MSTLSRAACALLLGLFAAGPAEANTPALWLSPTDDVTQRGVDFQLLFDDPPSWPAAAKRVTVFGVPVNYVLRTPPATVKRQLAWLRSHGIELAVGIDALPVDKHVCGDGIEGMIWPGEATIKARRLKELGAEVDYFVFDLPLTNGHIATNLNACHLSVAETANRLAASVREIRQFYPTARLIDAEVPTGIPLTQWTAALSEWLPAFRRASGEDFYALDMDVWWKFDWPDAARQTVRILAAQNIRAGIFLDATGNSSVSAQDWVADARANACALSDIRLAVDHVVIANWLDMQVKNLPETSPDTLTGFLNWFAAGPACAR